MMPKYMFWLVSSNYSGRDFSSAKMREEWYKVPY